MSSNLIFQVQAKTNINQKVAVVGNIPELGNWQPGLGILLITDTNSYPTWRTSKPVEIQINIEFEFKLCILEGDKVVRWEEIGKGQNRLYKTEFFKLALFLQENDPKITVKPIQRYNEAHDVEKMDLSNVRKIKTGRDYDPFNDDEADQSNYEESSFTFSDKFDSQNSMYQNDQIDEMIKDNSPVVTKACASKSENDLLTLRDQLLLVKSNIY